MRYRALGRTGWKVSEISFGAWAIGGSWGHVSDKDALAALHQAVDSGMNFIDTADVYGMGRSERLIAQVMEERRGELIVATKAGRRLPAQAVAGYTAYNLNAWIDDSLRNLRQDSLHLLQLHCPPADLYYHQEVFGILDRLVEAGKVQHYGVSVERVEEALKAIEYPNVKTVQIIFNCFRQRPAHLLFAEAKKKNVGLLARVPLASGLLTGKLTRDSQFEPDDHRNFNRRGEAFDVGETFSGVDFDLALGAVNALQRIAPEGFSLAQFALKWILMFDAVSCAIPGGKNPQQVAANAAASDLAPLLPEVMDEVRRIYESRIAPSVHQRW